MYGVDMHDVWGKDDNLYHLGLTPTGILLFKEEEKLGLFYWPKVHNLEFNKKQLNICVEEEDDQGAPHDITFIFKLYNVKACKHLWKCAVEHHSFFRLDRPSNPVHARRSFLRLGSRFRFSGKTEAQASIASQTRRSGTFSRKPSKRYSRRESHLTRGESQTTISDSDDTSHIYNCSSGVICRKISVSNCDGYVTEYDISTPPLSPKRGRSLKTSACERRAKSTSIEHLKVPEPDYLSENYLLKPRSRLSLNESYQTAVLNSAFHEQLKGNLKTDDMFRRRKRRSKSHSSTSSTISSGSKELPKRHESPRRGEFHRPRSDYHEAAQAIQDRLLETGDPFFTLGRMKPPMNSPSSPREFDKIPAPIRNYHLLRHGSYSSPFGGLQCRSLKQSYSAPHGHFGTSPTLVQQDMIRGKPGHERQLVMHDDKIDVLEPYPTTVYKYNGLSFKELHANDRTGRHGSRKGSVTSQRSLTQSSVSNAYMSKKAKAKSMFQSYMDGDDTSSSSSSSD